MKKKECFKCGETKPLTEFYKHPMMRDGRVNKCKECNKLDVRQNRRDKIGYYRAYDIQRYRDNPDRRAKVQKWYREKMAGSPAMKKATCMVANAIRDGRLKRQPCEVCGEIKSEAHHADYLRPFDVMWLCRSHHIQWHHDHGPGKNAEAPIEDIDAPPPAAACDPDTIRALLAERDALIEQVDQMTEQQENMGNEPSSPPPTHVAA